MEIPYYNSILDRFFDVLGLSPTSSFKELKSRYWRQHLWSVGYFCRSVGTITEKTIKDYIENQENESEENFKIVN